MCVCTRQRERKKENCSFALVILWSQGRPHVRCSRSHFLISWSSYISSFRLSQIKMQSELIEELSCPKSTILDNICHTGCCREIAFEIIAGSCTVATFSRSTFHQRSELKDWKRAMSLSREYTHSWCPGVFFFSTLWGFFCARLNSVLNVTLIDGAVTLGAVEESKWSERTEMTMFPGETEGQMDRWTDAG